jgi:type III pantothenate kinase
MNLVLDFGNTKIKAAVFSESNEIVDIFTWETYCEQLVNDIKSEYLIDSVLLCSVVDVIENVEQHLKNNFSFYLRLDSSTKLPIKNNYSTPQTLGLDRIAAAVGANMLCPNTPLLVIDMGTAITYDFVNSSNEYEGGNIAPGVNMRLRAMNNYTNKLPLLQARHEERLLGNDTSSAMMAGVMRGIEFEIEGYISEIKRKNTNLSVFLTGGDVFFFEKTLKSSIFVVSNLLLKGLNEILRYNKCILRD